MKKIILFCAFGFLINHAQAAPLPTHFTTATTVYYIGQPEAKLELNIFRESEASWAYVSVIVGDPETYKQQEDAVHKAYPGLKVERVMSRGTGKATLKIAALNISDVLDWIPYQNGPGLERSFELTKAQTLKLTSAQDVGLSITGQVKAYVSSMNVVESKTIPPSDYCDALLKNGKTLEQIFLNFPAVAKMIDTLPTRYPETKQGLKRAVLRQCLDVPETALIGSFRDLLEMKVMSASPTELVGETRKETPSEKEVSFSAELPKKVTSTVGG